MKSPIDFTCRRPSTCVTFARKREEKKRKKTPKHPSHLALNWLEIHELTFLQFHSAWRERERERELYSVLLYSLLCLLCYHVCDIVSDSYIRLCKHPQPPVANWHKGTASNKDQEMEVVTFPACKIKYTKAPREYSPSPLLPPLSHRLASSPVFMHSYMRLTHTHTRTCTVFTHSALVFHFNLAHPQSPQVIPLAVSCINFAGAICASVCLSQVQWDQLLCKRS